MSADFGCVSPGEGEQQGVKLSLKEAAQWIAGRDGSRHEARRHLIKNKLVVLQTPKGKLIKRCLPKALTRS